MDMNVTAPPDGPVVRFLRKSSREKFAAVSATLRQTLKIGRKIEPEDYLARHRWAAPGAIRSGLGFYVAMRPHSDRVMGAYPEMDELSQLWVRNNEKGTASDLPRLYALVLNIREILAEKIDGAFAELGVYRGNSAAVLAHYARKSGKTAYLFDTFEGFDARDLTGIDARHPVEFGDTSLAAVRALVGEESVQYIKGYFPGSLPPGLESRRFSLVHLDCDLYEPIKAGMEFFFPRLSPGGMMIVHDYSCISWAGVKKAVDEYLADRPERPVLIPDRSGTAMIRKIRD